VHLVGFITKKFVTMQHGHMNVKFRWKFRFCTWLYVVIHDRFFNHWLWIFL